MTTANTTWEVREEACEEVHQENRTVWTEAGKFENQGS